MWPRSTFLLLIAAALGAAVAPPSILRSAALPTAPSPPTPPAPDEAPALRNLPSLVKALASPDYNIRQQATSALLRLPPEARSDIEHALSTQSDEETLSRLTIVALHLFLKDPQQTPMDGQASLLGIALVVEPLHPDAAPDDHKKAVVVLETKPGFPSYEILQPNDRIVAIDHQPLLDCSFETFKAGVTSRPPGSFLNVTVLRHGKEFDAALRLAGLRHPGENFLIQFVDQRARDSQSYLDRLQKKNDRQPLVLQDDTPPDINIYNDIELQPVP